MSTPLIPVAFTVDLLDLVQEFACGDEPYERELADWIRKESVPTLDRGGRVWLYVTPEKVVVGYASLAVTRWHYPEPSSQRIALALIPAVAIQKSYWGKPDGPREGRYSSQILDHLISEAARLPISIPVLGLFVHPANERAIKLYERAGFRPFAHTYTDKETGITYRSFVRALAVPKTE